MSNLTFKGATVEGKQVTATVGGNLNIESLQDTATYAE
jgi:filamentous hemagglutinin